MGRARSAGRLYLARSSTEFAINPSVRAKLPYEPLKDFAHISQLAAVTRLQGHRRSSYAGCIRKRRVPSARRM
jgi:hypothetical protein